MCAFLNLYINESKESRQQEDTRLLAVHACVTYCKHIEINVGSKKLSLFHMKMESAYCRYLERTCSILHASIRFHECCMVIRIWWHDGHYYIVDSETFSISSLVNILIARLFPANSLMATFVRAVNQFSQKNPNLFVEKKIKIVQENSKIMHRYFLSVNDNVISWNKAIFLVLSRKN